MGAKFIIDRRCPVKESLTLSGLIEAVRHRVLLRRIGDLVAAGVLPACDDGARLDLVLPPESGLPGALTIADLVTESDGLMAYRTTCHRCTSARKGQVGGCIAYLPYPISEGAAFLLWHTAVRALEGELPEPYLPAARAFAQKALTFRRTPVAASLRQHGDLLGPKPHVYQTGPVWRRQRLTSDQVVDAFFPHTTLLGDELRLHAGFLGAALAMARGMAAAMTGEDRREALEEDVAAYAAVHELMVLALDRRQGIYVWP